MFCAESFGVDDGLCDRRIDRRMANDVRSVVCQRSQSERILVDVCRFVQQGLDKITATDVVD